MESKKSIWPKAIVIFFAVVLSVNGFFIYKSVSGFEGLVEDNYYEKGLNYNNVIQQAKRLGWKIELSFADGLNPTAQNRAKVSISDTEGKAVDGLTVQIALRRPATDKFDDKFELAQSQGAYYGSVSVPVSGFWDMVVTAKKGTDRVEKIFRLRTV